MIRPLMPESPLDALRRAVRDLHRCEAVFVRAVPVREAIEGQPPWEGLVSIFDLTGHPTSLRAYAWSHETGNGAARCYTALLHKGNVMSPETAVRAAVARRR
jgi:hypothetical protein